MGNGGSFALVKPHHGRVTFYCVTTGDRSNSHYTKTAYGLEEGHMTVEDGTVLDCGNGCSLVAVVPEL